GLTYVEALAAGVPALCRAAPCLAEVVRDGENGWQYRDRADFRRKLDLFLSQPHRRERLAQNARRTAESYSAQRFAERVETIYRQQITRRAGEQPRREVPA
ncbi:MAG: glycosyltransferase, partial [Oscillospiraceae bacterium]|nr:glycosyltransferase [Oscillospiraceae bacterium]